MSVHDFRNQAREMSAPDRIMNDRRSFEEWFNGTMYTEEAKEAMLIGWQARSATAGNAAPTDADENAPWLTLAHTICADAGIQPGHITDRLKTLRDLLEAALRGNATSAAAPGDLPMEATAKLDDLLGRWAEAAELGVTSHEVIRDKIVAHILASNAGAAKLDESLGEQK
jgi:hypothetical protein